jgi:hypothetical protein
MKDTMEEVAPKLRKKGHRMQSLMKVVFGTPSIEGGSKSPNPR